MSETNAPPQAPAEAGEQRVVYATFAGVIDQAALQRIFLGLSGTMAQGTTSIHLLFQSTGGSVADGVALYNFLRTLPIQVSLYNVGTVASIGAIAYLGAKTRRTSAAATFMIHRTQAILQNITAERLEAAAASVRLDDERTEKILRAHLKLPKKSWDVHRMADLWLSAEEALRYGLATEIAEFQPPTRTVIYNI